MQKGEGENHQSASLSKGQIIENLTLEEAIKLFQLPRVVGEYQGVDIVATKGRFGPYIKWGDRNVSLPRTKDPLNISLDECVAVIESDSAKKEAVAAPIHEWADSGISVVNGRYGPYIKHDGRNYRIPKGVDAELLTEDKCREIIAGGTPTVARKYNKKK